MKAFFCISIFLSVTIFISETNLWAQNTDGLLIMLKGDGSMIRNKQVSQLKIAQNFNSGDKIIIENGKAGILLSTGDEVDLGAGQQYTINTSKSSIVLNNTSKFLAKNSYSDNAATYAIRGNVPVFPKKSSLNEQEKLAILWKTDITPNLKLELFENATGEIVSIIEKIDSKEIELNGSLFKPGNDYYWIISDGIVSEKGEINFLANDSINKIQNFTLTNKVDYLNAFNYYVEKDLLFKAYSVINQAIDKFPEADIFPVLKEKLIE